MSKNETSTSDVECDYCGEATALVCPTCDVAPLCNKCQELHGECVSCADDPEDDYDDDDDDDDDEDEDDTFTDHEGMDDDDEDSGDEGSTGESDK